jgi:hypothetical protein
MEDQSADTTRKGWAWGGSPPWEQHGGLRTPDPRRAALLWWLACVSNVAAQFTLMPPFALVFSPFALAFGVPAWVLAARDLSRMKRGEMDARGLDITEDARRIARLSVAAAVFSAVWTGLLLCLYWFYRKSLDTGT